MQDLNNIKITFFQTQNTIIFHNIYWKRLSKEIKNVLLERSVNFTHVKHEYEYEFNLSEYKFIIKALNDFGIYSSTYLLKQSNILNYSETYSRIINDEKVEYVSCLRNIIVQTDGSSETDSQLLLSDSLALKIALDEDQKLFNICKLDNDSMDRYFTNMRRLLSQSEINSILKYTNDVKCDLLYIDINNHPYNLMDTILTNELLSKIKILRYLGMYISGNWYTFDLNTMIFNVDNNQYSQFFLES